MTRYRYTVVHDGTVEADTPAEAEAAALAEVEDGLCDTHGVEVEPLVPKEATRDE